jgi:DNA topoisomerase-1
MIWERFVACQMTPAQWDSTTCLIEGGTDPEAPAFKATGRASPSTGSTASRACRERATTVLPDARGGQEHEPVPLDPQQKFTSPPPRYTEASLIKTLESEGIGRPSTYASIIR